MRRLTRGVLALVVFSVTSLVLDAVASPDESCPSGSVAYATGGGWTGEQCMDVRTPSGTGPFPAVVIVHGGGWNGGSFRSPSWTRDAALLTNRGFVTFSIEYDRLSVARNVGYLQEPADIRNALLHIRANAATYRVDPQRVGLIGDSAGGHLALLTAYRHPDLVTAVVSWSGPSDLAAMTRDFGCGNYPCADDPSPQWTGRRAQMFVGRCTVDAALATSAWRQCADSRYHEMAPARWVASASPPSLLAAATEDPLVPFTQHQLLVDAATSAGALYREVIVAGGQHGTLMREQPGDPPGLWRSETVPFLEDCVMAPPCARTGRAVVTTTSAATTDAF